MFDLKNQLRSKKLLAEIFATAIAANQPTFELSGGTAWPGGYAPGGSCSCSCRL